MIITGKGQPDVATRLFLKMVKTALKIPILGLFDSDPHGLKVRVKWKGERKRNKRRRKMTEEIKRIKNMIFIC